VNLASGQQYYVEVSSPTGSLFAYSLSIAQTSGGGTSVGGGGKHHLVALGIENPDDQAGGDVFYQNAADDPENARSARVGPASGSSHSQLSNVELAAAASAGVALSAAGVFQDGAGSQRGPAGARPNFGQQVAPIVSAATPVPAGVVTGP